MWWRPRADRLKKSNVPSPLQVDLLTGAFCRSRGGREQGIKYALLQSLGNNEGKNLNFCEAFFWQFQDGVHELDKINLDRYQA